jgi:uncharacterized protein YqjF (DUF2071 family)
MAQTWRELLFAHWPLPREVLRAVVPAELPLDTYEGQAWIGIVPFDLSVIRARATPPVPGASRFLELNVRTYVTLGGKPGVYFFSLDAGNPLAVLGARAIDLNYFYAWMGMERRGDEKRYRSLRLSPQPTGAALRARYRPVGAAASPSPGTLAHWLTERYCLYAVGRGGRVSRLEIHHPPWRLAQAEAAFALNTMTAPLGVRLPDTAPLLHYSERQDMVCWLPETVRA